ncbi:hypothetical protein ACFWOB_32640 [Streptomyces sp. NPDC058420]|uniref:hypothetical protein n=1 Tax=Streptomyces sp. NPDC058420 TaxID=3346489 RepID=UPI00365F49A1
MGTTKWSTALGAAGLALAATTTTVATPASAHTFRAGRIVLTNADNGRTVPASVGGDVEVRLTHYRERGVTYTWTPLNSDNSGVLGHRSDVTNPAGDASAVYRAAAAGTATVSAQRHCVPDPGNLCPLIVETWKATIQVK